MSPIKKKKRVAKKAVKKIVKKKVAKKAAKKKVAKKRIAKTVQPPVAAQPPVTPSTPAAATRPNVVRCEICGREITLDNTGVADRVVICCGKEIKI